LLRLLNRFSLSVDALTESPEPQYLPRQTPVLNALQGRINGVLDDRTLRRQEAQHGRGEWFGSVVSVVNGGRVNLTAV
jgi:hypothetical protein